MKKWSYLNFLQTNMFEVFISTVVSHMPQLAQLSPEIIHLALIGALLEHITLKSLKTGLPADWEEQKKFLRIE